MGDDAAVLGDVLGDLSHVGAQLRDDKNVGVQRGVRVRLEAAEFTSRLDLEQPVRRTRTGVIVLTRVKVAG